MQQLLQQIWLAVGWNGITAIASLLTVLATLILVIKDLKRQQQTKLHPLSSPSRRTRIRPATIPRRRKKHHKKRKRR